MNDLINDNCFLEGELVYLRKPDIEKDIVNGFWHQWFNDYDITRFLVHGNYPNDKYEQERIVREQLNNKSTLLLSIIDKSTCNMVGVISLKFIDLINRTAEIGMVLGYEKKQGMAIESMALITQHAFDRLNLVKVYAGSHEEHWSFVNTIETIGYKIEGIQKNMGIRDGKSYNYILTGITNKDYYNLIEARRGKLISSFDEIYRIKRKENLALKVQCFLDALYNNY